MAEDKSGLLGSLLRLKPFRMNMFRLLRADDVVMMTRQVDDHFVCFTPEGVIGRRLYVSGDWHRSDCDKAIEILDKHGVLTSGGTALDLGANIGTQSLYLALSAKFSRVVSVEPEPKNFKMLRINALVNDLEDTMLPVQAAIAEKSGEAPLFLSPGFSSGGNSLVERAGAEKVSVPTRRIVEILEETETDPASVSFCWIDTEGFDHECMRQVARDIGPDVPIFAEIGSSFNGKAAMDAFLADINATYSAIYVFNQNGQIEFFDNGRAVLQTETADILAFNPPSPPQT